MHRQALKHLVVFGTACGLGLGAAAARAEDDGIKTTISGYGTVAGTFTNNDSYSFNADAQKFKGAGTRIDTGLDSRLGLQAVVKFAPEFSFTAQALASRLGDKDYDIHAEWAYGQYTPFTGVDIRLGRVVLPAFLISDSRNVGYAQPWLRAPVDVYGPFYISNMDGVQANWRVNAGPVTFTTQLSYGASTTLITAGALGELEVNARDLINVAFTAETGDWTARVAQTQLKAPKLPLPFGPHNLEDKFVSAGLQYDNGTALVLAEWARRTENDVVGQNKPLASTTAWYVAAGYRFAKLTPMVRYSVLKDNGGLITYFDKPVIGASLRYDVVRNVALKLQVDRYDASNFYSFVNPATTPGTKVTVVSFGADFVF
jgi:hypothetical protein